MKGWVRRIIHGAGGFNSHRAKEGGATSRFAVAAWTIRCLANVRCSGSGAVLKEILQRRAHVKGMTSDVTETSCLLKELLEDDV